MDKKLYDLYYSSWNYILHNDDNSNDYMNQQIQDAVAEEKEN